jgi:hypothetical protein
MMHTKDKLAAALCECGLDEMANAAANGYYDDFLSPLDMPTTQLIKDLSLIAHGNLVAIQALLVRVVHGEFEATQEESDAWAMSPEGQETFRKLLR